MKTVALNNLGCSKNIVDGETIASYLNSCGFQLVESFDSAEIIIVNTCTFIQEATSEAINTILEMARYKKNGSCKSLIVAGCLSERYRNTIPAQLPEVDFWAGVHSWKEDLNRFLSISGTNMFTRHLSEPMATQYLKISDGCSHRCSYCIIPSIRGSFHSRTVDDIVREAQWLSSQGVKECILVSQDTSFYGRDGKTSLRALLETLLVKTDFHWIRMMYLHPRYVDDTLLKLVASEKRLCSYFDIPLQHIADPILKKMNRSAPSSADIYRLIERIRTLVTDATIRTAFILGFPGETESQFKQLLTFIEWARFEKCGVFPFSAEDGTPAAAFSHRPRNTTAQKRCDTLMDLQRQISRERCEKHIGSQVEIIIDGVSEETDYSFVGRTQGDAPEIDGRVFVIDSKAEIGDFTNVNIVDANDYDLFARVQ